MDPHLLILVWIAGAVIGLYYSFRGAREAWADLIAVGPGDPAMLEVASTALKIQILNASIQITWLALGVLAIVAVAGPLILWGLIFTNYALAFKSRANFKSKRRVLEIILKQNKERS